MSEVMPDSASIVAEREHARCCEILVKLGENPRTFTLWQRIQIFLAAWIGYIASLLIGRSLRWEIFDCHNFEAAERMGKRTIFACWHRVIFSGVWFWRKRGMVVMTSQNFDGECIARILRKHGYGAARGSSSRGAIQALKDMIRVMRSGLDTAFTVDGPRGPRFVAKPGAIQLAKATGAPIFCFHVALKYAFVLRKSWDLFQIPFPFSRAALLCGAPVLVARDAGEAEQSQKLREVQSTLEALQRRGEEWALKES